MLKIKITKFNIGKYKQYKGLCIKWLWFKFERIGFKNKFLWRFELSNWSE
jgi:hypothetical protein